MISSTLRTCTKPSRNLKNVEQSSRFLSVLLCNLKWNILLSCYRIRPWRYTYFPSQSSGSSWTLWARETTELQPFLGLINCYRKFIPNMSTLVSSLHQLLSKVTPLCWSKECQVSFQALKDTLAWSNVLVHYNPKLEVQLAVDASQEGFGSGNFTHHCWWNWTFYRLRLTIINQVWTELFRNWDRRSSHHLCNSQISTFLYDRRFTLLTVYQPLTLLFGSKKAIPAVAASSIKRWAIRLSAYPYDIKYGKS